MKCLLNLFYFITNYFLVQTFFNKMMPYLNNSFFVFSSAEIIAVGWPVLTCHMLVFLHTSHTVLYAFAFVHIFLFGSNLVCAFEGRFHALYQPMFSSSDTAAA